MLGVCATPESRGRARATAVQAWITFTVCSCWMMTICCAPAGMHVVGERTYLLTTESMGRYEPKPCKGGRFGAVAIISYPYPGSWSARRRWESDLCAGRPCCHEQNLLLPNHMGTRLITIVPARDWSGSGALRCRIENQRYPGLGDRNKLLWVAGNPLLSQPSCMLSFMVAVFAPKNPVHERRGLRNGPSAS
jgi:hypothetical protein